MSSMMLSAPLTGPQADRYPLLVTVLLAGIFGALVLRTRPKLALAAFLVVLAFVPVWLGINISSYFMPVTLVGFFVLFVLLPIPSIHWGPADLTVGFFFAACLVPLVAGGSTKSTIFTVLTEWTMPFLLGRLVAYKIDMEWIYKIVSIVFTVVSVLAILEFLLHFNPFVMVSADNPLYVIWGKLQERGGVIRAEGAFGHSIALGASVAMAIPLTLAANFRLSTRLLMTAAMLGCTVVTFSRISMLCAALSVVISVVVLRDRLGWRVRAAIIGVFVVMTAVLIPLVSRIFSAAGDEATNSASYRGDLASLIPTISIVGYSSSAHRTPAGDLYFGRFRSIDSGLVLLGLSYGWLALGFAVCLLLCAVTLVVLRRATPPTIAVVAQIPALASVALITQYGTMLFFMIGLAVFAQMHRRPDRADDQPPISSAVPALGPAR